MSTVQRIAKCIGLWIILDNWFLIDLWLLLASMEQCLSNMVKYMLIPLFVIWTPKLLLSVKVETNKLHCLYFSVFANYCVQSVPTMMFVCWLGPRLSSPDDWTEDWIVSSCTPHHPYLSSACWLASADC